MHGEAQIKKSLPISLSDFRLLTSDHESCINDAPSASDLRPLTSPPLYLRRRTIALRSTLCALYFLPALAEEGPDLSRYDVIFLGYPNWGSDMPPVVKTYLSSHDFSGKTVIPFCTNGGGGWGRSVESLKELAPGANVAEGYEMQGGQVDKGRVSQWLRRIGL